MTDLYLYPTFKKQNADPVVDCHRPLRIKRRGGESSPPTYLMSTSRLFDKRDKTVPAPAASFNFLLLYPPPLCPEDHFFQESKAILCKERMLIAIHRITGTYKHNKTFAVTGTRRRCPRLYTLQTFSLRVLTTNSCDDLSSPPLAFERFLRGYTWQVNFGGQIRKWRQRGEGEGWI